VFEEALHALDRAAQARALLQRDGLVVASARGGLPHLHPAVKIEKDALATFSAAWRALNFAAFTPDDAARVAEPTLPPVASLQRQRNGRHH
jgi:hypothetical protein